MEIWELNPPERMNELTISEVNGLKPPPLFKSADFESFLIRFVFACIHPSLNPGASIFEKDPKEIIGHWFAQYPIESGGSLV